MAAQLGPNGLLQLGILAKEPKAQECGSFQSVAGSSGLSAALASVVLVGAMVAAITLSTLLTAFVEGRTGAPTDHPSEPRALTERTSRGPTTTVERTHPATTEEQTTTTSTATPTATAAPTATATPYSRLR